MLKSTVPYSSTFLRSRRCLLDACGAAVGGVVRLIDGHSVHRRGPEMLDQLWIVCIDFAVGDTLAKRVCQRLRVSLGAQQLGEPCRFASCGGGPDGHLPAHDGE